MRGFYMLNLLSLRGETQPLTPFLSKELLSGQLYSLPPLPAPNPFLTASSQSLPPNLISPCPLPVLPTTVHVSN